MADRAGLKFDLRLYRLSLFHRLLNIEHSKRLRNGDEERIVGNVATGTDATAVAEDVITRIGLGCVSWSCDVTLGAEGHWVGVNSGVVGEPPRGSVGMPMGT